MKSLPLDIHGYNNIIFATIPHTRAVWLIAILLALGASIWWSSLTLLRFYNNPTSTSTQLVVLNSLALPDVHICTHQIVDVNKFDRANLSRGLVEHVLDYFVFERIARLSHVSMHESQSHLRDAVADAELREAMRKRNMTTFDEFLIAFSVDCRDYILDCTIDSTPFNCCALVERPTLNSYHGACFTLQNLSSVAKQTWVGAQGGLYVLIDPLVGSRSRYPLELSTYVELADHFVAPTLDEYVVRVNKTTRMSVEMKEIRRSSESAIGCQIPASIGLETSHCPAALWGVAEMQLCNCSEVGFEIANFSATFADIAWRSCFPIENGACYAIYDDVNDAYIRDLATQCGRPLCFERNYRASQTVSELDVGQLQTMRGDRSRNTFSMFYVYHASLSYTLLTEFSSITYDAVLSAIGGNFGLFLGASVISLIQASMLFGRCCMSMLESKRNQKKLVKSTSAVLRTLAQIEVVTVASIGATDAAIHECESTWSYT